MRVIRKICFLGLLVVAILLFVQNASATHTEMLPESSHYEGRTHYSTVIEDGILSGRIDFAVYDTENGNEFVNAGFQVPGLGRYIYAYQIFNDAGINPAVAYFAILGIEGAPVDGIGSQNDPGNGVEPTDEYFTVTVSEGVWEFWEPDRGILFAGDHSYFLVLTSETDWVAGEYDIKTNVPPDVFPRPPIPEPGTLTLLGVGGLILLRIKGTERIFAGKQK